MLPISPPDCASTLLSRLPSVFVCDMEAHLSLEAASMRWGEELCRGLFESLAALSCYCKCLGTMLLGSLCKHEGPWKWWCNAAVWAKSISEDFSLGFPFTSLFKRIAVMCAQAFQLYFLWLLVPDQIGFGPCHSVREFVVIREANYRWLLTTWQWSKPDALRTEWCTASRGARAASRSPDCPENARHLVALPEGPALC